MTTGAGAVWWGWLTRLISILPMAFEHSGRPKSLVLFVCIPTLLVEFCRGLLNPVLPLYAASFKASVALAGIFLGAEGIGMLIGDLPAGIPVGMSSLKRGMLLGIGLVTISALLMGRARAGQQLGVLPFVAEPREQDRFRCGSTTARDSPSRSAIGVKYLPPSLRLGHLT